MNMKVEDKIKIYTNETCPYCKRIKEELTKNSIDFDNQDIVEYKSEWQMNLLIPISVRQLSQWII